MAVINDDPNGDNWTTAVEIGTTPRISYPLQSIGSTTAIIYERDFVIASGSWSPLALDTADGTYSSAYLFEETEPQEIGGGIVQWTRRFGTVPSSFTSYSYESYTFPGYYDSYETDTNFRSPQPKMAAAKLNYTFMKTADPYTDFAVGTQTLTISNSRGEIVDYVDSGTTPSYSTYTGYVSGGTTISIADPRLDRLYGSGNIWQQIEAVAKAE
jgi:hypothetical protein